MSIDWCAYYLIFLSLILVTSGDNASSSISLRASLEIPEWLKDIHLPNEDKILHLRQRILANITNMISGLERCYVSEYAGYDLDLFSKDINILSVIYTIVTKEIHHSTKDKLIERAKIVVRNLIELIKTVLECINRPPSEQSPFGLTSVAVMSPDEFQLWLNPKLMKAAPNFKASLKDGGSKCESHSRLRRHIEENFEYSSHRRSKRWLLWDLFNKQATMEIPRVVDHRRRSRHRYTQRRRKYVKHSRRSRLLPKPFPSQKKAIPEEFSWLKKGKITRVKNQGRCGSCFIFAAMSTIESAYMIQKGLRNPSDAEFSEQAVLDCLPDRNTCKNGGFPEEAYQVVMKNGAVPYHNLRYSGIQSECSDYPYEFKLKDYCIHNHNSVDDLKTMLMKHGPLAVGINAHSFHYVRGVFNGRCEDSINHVVTLVGWNRHYWIIKNSWGPRWGDRGFTQIRQTGYTCGIQLLAGYPILD